MDNAALFTLLFGVPAGIVLILVYIWFLAVMSRQSKESKNMVKTRR